MTRLFKSLASLYYIPKIQNLLEYFSRLSFTEFIQTQLAKFQSQKTSRRFSSLEISPRFMGIHFGMSYFVTDKQQEVDLHSLRTDESSSSDGPAGSGTASGAMLVSGTSSGSGGPSGSHQGGSGSSAGGPQAKPGDSMSRIPGLKKELSHTNSISGPTLPRYGIQLKEDKEEELAEVRKAGQEDRSDFEYIKFPIWAERKSSQILDFSNRRMTTPNGTKTSQLPTE